MSDDPRRTGMCTPTCYRECRCSRWPDMVDRWGNPVNHSGGVIPDWWLAGGILASQCVAAYRAIATPGSAWGAGPANIAASYINLNDPGTNDAAPGTAPGWAAATGWAFLSASSTWLETGILPSPGTWSVFVQYSNSVSNVWGVFGCYSAAAGASRFYLYPTFNPTTAVIYGTHGIDRIVIPEQPTGNLGMAGIQGYRNGVAEGLPMGGGGADPGISFIIGGIRRDAGPGEFFSGNIHALAIYSVDIAAAVPALVAAMAAL